MKIMIAGTQRLKFFNGIIMKNLGMILTA